jgi:hypothetical protein
MKSIFAVAAVLLLGACATFHVDSQTVESCGPNGQPAGDAKLCRLSEEGGLLPPDEFRRLYAAEALNTGEPMIGLALGGGGSKAGPVAVGVLAGLEEAGILKEVDAISSVSGGGYAAYFYMRELMNLQAPPSSELKAQMDIEQAVGQLFEDCVPRADGYSWITGVPEYQPGLPFGARHGVRCRDDQPALDDDASYSANFESFKTYLGAGNPYVPQMIVRYQQDLLSAKFDFINSGRSGLRRLIRDGRYLVGDVGELVTGHAVAFPADLLMNQIFDVNSELSPSKHSYRLGIRDSYGAFDFECGRAVRFRKSTGTDCGKAYGEGNDFARLAEFRRNSIACPEMQNGGKPCRHIPLWIVNMTSGHSRHPLVVADFGELNVTRDSFEITSYGYGSGEYGYYSGEPPMNMLTAVTTSGAFFDSQAKNLGQPARAISGAWMSSLGLNWGEDIANPRVSEAERALHRFLPWPLYWAHGFTRDQHSVDIHLSDGGQSENLGIYALLRRGVKDIIIVDAPEDDLGSMDSLCHVKNQLSDFAEYRAWRRDPERHAPPVSIRFPDLTKLFELCSGEKKGGYDIHHWSRPVLVGCAMQLTNLGDSSDPEKYRDEIRNLEQVERGCNDTANSKLISRLFLIKPAFDEKWICGGASSLRELAGKGANGGTADLSPCLKSGFPAEVAMFLLAEIDPDQAPSDTENGEALYECPEFPQHRTVNITANSDALVYGAYRELARYLASHLQMKSGQLTTKAFRLEGAAADLDSNASNMPLGAKKCKLI